MIFSMGGDWNDCQETIIPPFLGYCAQCRNDHVFRHQLRHINLSIAPSINHVGPLLQHVAPLLGILSLVVDRPGGTSLLMR